jgi:hypothetical protein
MVQTCANEIRERERVVLRLFSKAGRGGVHRLVLRKEERGGDRLVQSSTVFIKAGDWHRPVLKRGRNYTAIFSGKRREGEWYRQH